MDWNDTVKFFAALFAIMNPIGGMPVFLSVTAGKSNSERARIALAARVGRDHPRRVRGARGRVAEGLRHLGGGLRAAGGLIILSIAFSLLHAKAERHSPDRRRCRCAGKPRGVSARDADDRGAGAISTVIVFAHGTQGAAGYATLIAVILLMAVLIYVGMRMAVVTSR